MVSMCIIIVIILIVNVIKSSLTVRLKVKNAATRFKVVDYMIYMHINVWVCVKVLA